MSRALVISHDVVGPKMAGPGIRYAALARVLAQHGAATLAAPEGAAPVDEGVPLHVYRPGDWPSLAPAVAEADVLVLPGDLLAMFPPLRALDVPVVVDGYDPHAIETLFLRGRASASEHRARLRILSLACLTGDFFICAGEAQRTWWLGWLEAHGRVNAHTVGEDPSLRRLLDRVPFGLPAAPFPDVDAALPAVAPDDRVLLWGGGLWDWLDPLLAVRAMPAILAAEPRARLLFPGTRHPNPAVPPMAMVAEARALVEELGLASAVVFGGWAPRETWLAYLRRADVGLSLHPDTVEARLAFRSRLLDYAWAGLPMVVTEGDETSTLVRRRRLGEVVPPEDATAVAAAVLRVLARPKSAYSDLFARARAALTWERAAEPLVAFCAAPRIAPDKRALGAAPGNPYYIDERAELAELVAAYERGRFIRFTRWLHNLWRRALGRWNV